MLDTSASCTICWFKDSQNTLVIYATNYTKTTFSAQAIAKNKYDEF